MHHRQLLQQMIGSGNVIVLNSVIGLQIAGMISWVKQLAAQIMHMNILTWAVKTYVIAEQIYNHKPFHI